MESYENGPNDPRKTQSSRLLPESPTRGSTILVGSVRSFSVILRCVQGLRSLAGFFWSGGREWYYVGICFVNTENGW